MKSFLLSLLFLSSVIIAQQETKSILYLEEVIQNQDYSSVLLTSEIDPLSSSEKKSVGLGILYSLLLPGMGELYADAYNVGMYFTIADGLLWGTFIGMNAYSNWQKDNYKSYAATRAGVNNSGKDENYYATIGEYSNIFNYNDEKALERNFEDMYDEQSFFWKWQTTEERKTYREMWSSSEQTNNDLRFVVGGLILNRVISAINAARLVSAYNNRIADEMSWNVSVGFENCKNLPTNLSLRFVKSF